MDKLYFLTGPLEGGTAELIGEEIRIGRASDNDICIDDESLSDHHAVITRQNKECILRDLQSARGTTVRGNKAIVVTLEDSDRITFGSVEAEFTTTEVKLHMPKTTVLTSPSRVVTVPQPAVSGASSGEMSYGAAIRKLMPLVFLVVLAGGGWFAYQKFYQKDSSGEAAPAVNQQATSPAAPTAPVTTAAALPAPSAPAGSPTTAPAAQTAPADTPLTGSAVAQPASVPASAAPQALATQSNLSASATQPTAAGVPQPPTTPAPAGAQAAATQPGSPAPVTNSTSSNASQPAPAVVDIKQLKPADWVQGLPGAAQTRYLEIQGSLRGTERVDAIRFWLATWRRQLRDPNLTLVELDYIRKNVENRDSVVYAATNVVDTRQGASIESALRARLGVLDSLESMMRAMQARGIKQPALFEIIGECREKISKERADIVVRLTQRSMSPTTTRKR